MRAGGAALVLALGATVAPLASQSSPVARKLGLASLERQLQAKRQELAKRESDTERWMDVLMRHHLGIDIDGGRPFALSDAERLRPRAEVEKQVATELEAVAHWNRELEQLRDQLVTARESATEQIEESNDDLAWQPQAAQPEPKAPKMTIPRTPRTITEEPVPAATAHDHAADQAKPVPGLIHGIGDRQQLGMAFFMAGQYGRAKDQLARYENDDAAPFAALFYLARTYEKLGDLARADGVYLRIEALDEDRGANGSWASAARTARQHMNWLRDHGDWTPPVSPTQQQP